ncbi:LuxR C-terminal-related transcriptional regulator [Arthrobacter terricola]|uniref:LuxR family transcriptional regulator n=1 Tax=Arthrobacter terricola TaxID=2547396 RepID=A0A4R5KLN2_9MICC|nr:LuxR C-terminal-related transcriptional regulator [Arthrobacter terricola]MBT8161166.1 LuxR family transcriptional regulator [Arthrobacter sp. GN70]TDF96416.1 LuxR family transcriptional regulator [Arthrobacter terricola]
MVDSLSTPDVYGVVVVGAPGAGKATFARSVEARLNSKVHVLHLHGSADAEAPFGSMAHLLARLPAEVADNPGAVIHGISHLIHSDAAGREVLVVLSELPSLDSMSTAVLVQLLISGVAKVLVTVRQVTDMPEDLIRLLKDGLLDEVELQVFSRSEVSKLLGGILGNRVTATAASALHAASGGSPLVLQAIVTEQLRSGNLHLAGQVWAMKGEIHLSSAEVLTELVRSRLAKERPAVQEALELMALIRTAPLAVLLDVLEPSAVAEMEWSGYLRIESSGPRRVSLRDDYMGEVMRGWMDLPRRNELRRLAAGVIGSIWRDLDAEALLGFAASTLNCREPLEPAVALAASTAANRQFDPWFALECARQITPDDKEWVAAAQQRCVSHVMLAEHEAAVAALEAVAPEHLQSLSAYEYADYVQELCSALLWVPDGHLRIPGIVAEAFADLDGRAQESGTDTADISRARGVLRLASFELQVHQGEYAEVAGALEEEYRDGTDLEQRLNCGSLLIMAWAVLGREMEAVELARELRHKLQRAKAQPRLHNWLSEGLFAALLCSGQWEELARMLTQTLDQQPKNIHYLGGAAELALGVAYTYAGRAAVAIDTLLGAQAQLEIRRNYYGPSLAYSALAFAYAQAGDVKEARTFLDLADKSQSETAWFPAWMAEFCVRMARRWLKDPGAKQGLMESAARDLAKGRMTTASISLFGATVHGTEEELLLLEEVSSRRQGKMAAVNRMVAEGSRKKEPKTLLLAASVAQELKLDAVEARCAVLALDTARDVGDSASARQAQQRLDRLVGTVPVLPLTPHSFGPELTERERQVAKMASQGLSNKEVATQLQVSVRTVEGHLYQIFTKMGISSRSELEGTAQP